MHIISLTRTAILTALLMVITCLVVNYIFTYIYYHNCTGLFSYGSPNCDFCLAIMGGCAVLYTYIWYLAALTVFVIAFDQLKTILTKT